MIEGHAVYTARIDDGEVLAESIKRISPSGYYLQPMISTDGQDVVFWGRGEDGDSFDIWRASSDGHQRRRLTQRPCVDGHPFWTRDGARIIFFSTGSASGEQDWRMSCQFDTQRPARHLWMMDRDGGGRIQVTDGDHVDERPCISTDGQEVVFVSNRTGWLNLWRLDLVTGQMAAVSEHAHLDYRPVLSPDGRQIAYFSDANDDRRHDLMIGPWPKGEPSVAAGPERFAWIHGPFWLASGAGLLFHAKALDDSRRCALWQIRLADGAIRSLDVPGFSVYGHGSLSEDGRTLAFDAPVNQT